MNMDKKVFVTVGTTQFDELIKIVLSDPHKKIQIALKEKGFTHLIIQSGKSPIDSTGKYARTETHFQ